METRNIGFSLILLAVIVLTCAQMIIKARLSVHGVIPFQFGALSSYLWNISRDVVFLLGLLSLVVSSVCWYAALSRLPLSIAYPFDALSYPVIFLGALIFLGEAFSWQALAGNVLIVIGLALVASASIT